MDIKKGIALALQSTGELGGRKPDMERLVEALMPVIKQAQGEALREAARDARQFLSTYESAEWLENRADSIEKEGAVL